MLRLLCPAPLRMTLCLLVLLLIGGCSVVRLGYSHLNSVATWMAHDYFDLNTEQRDNFARQFDRLHAWHRYEQLPEYAQFLEDMQKRAQRGLQTADMLWLIDGFRQRYAKIAVRAAADSADLLATLSPAQIEHFRKELEQNNRKFLRENRSEASETERRKVYEQKTLSQLHEWLGHLSDAQEARIIALLKSVPLVDRLRHEDRLRRQREFMVLMEQRNGDRKVFAQRLSDWLVHWEAGRSPRQAQLLDESWQKRAEFYAAVDRMLSTEQRSHLVFRLQDYIDNFRQLSERKPTIAKSS